MKSILYPLKFEPVYQYRLWGGRKLESLLSKPLPKNESIGEAWILSDRKDHASKVSDGPLQGYTITQLMKQYPGELMGKLKDRFDRFPLLLKFLDCKEVLSVQVHPSDNQKKYIPDGDTGKTEAWVVLEAAKDSLIYAGLTPGTNKQNLSKAVQSNSVEKHLHSFIPKQGDGIFIHSGTVHTLKGAIVFEVQENSDVTFRLYDWDRTDTKTGKHRELQVADALACIDFEQINIGPVIPVNEGDKTEKLFDDDHFIVWRTQNDSSFTVGYVNEPRILVCIEGNGELYYEDYNFSVNKGDVMLLPASVGQCNFRPDNEITLLEIAIPDKQMPLTNPQ
ncbi:type I phosphomannose isomerase catalytic subunit [Mucilaginibacter lappiensis]|uniref:Mannose-6-phosphate isomerase n=1 Tax=Mucilaginibacter lappiensis TaxID=354630 RepID=A0A841JCZ4_9SPHI|nr:type I phosphomannose isomerase catalytic subunit [Mucilaginibacter lappiensis]MBB6126468.1 mannose-6-phosphate isomerase [Mucilaginibacter lappiensis]